MEKFTKVIRGYDPNEVNNFIDNVIVQLEKIVKDHKEQEKIIVDQQKEIELLKSRVSSYEKLESSLNSALSTAQDNSEYLRRMAKQESDMILDNARKNANRIVNDSLMRAQKIEYDAATLRKNISVFKNKLRLILENQIQMVDEIDHEEL